MTANVEQWRGVAAETADDVPAYRDLLGQESELVLP